MPVLVLMLVLGTMLAASGVATPSARAALEPIGLRVDGGEDVWRAERLFTVRWGNPAGVVAVHYRLLDPEGGEAIADTRLPWAATKIEPLHVPADPGAYTAEVRLEDADAALGPAATVALRFDDSEPGPVEASSPAAWLGRTSFPLAIRLTHPSGPPPPSGIRGYAVSIDASPLGRPCPTATCAAAEIDLGGGIDDDSLAVGELSEGTSYLHAVAVSGAAVPSATVGTTTLRVDKTDPVTTLAGVSAGWSRRPVTLTARASDGGSGMYAAGPFAPFTAIRVDGSAPVLAAGETARATLISSGVHDVSYYARDAAGNVDDGGVSNGLRNRPPRTAVVRIDRDPPAAAFAVSQDPADPELILARASDDASGVDPRRGEIAVRPVGSGRRFRALPTRFEAGALRARWDSAADRPGEYEFRATAFDRAGNSVATGSRSSGVPMRLRAPLKPGLKLRAHLGRTRIRYGRGTWFGGRLLAGRRTPLAGMPVRVIERFAAGAAPARRVTVVHTAAGGRFGLRLRPGPSRSIRAVVAATATTREAGSAARQLAVRGHVGLRASARVARVGGRPIVLRGKVGSRGGRPLAEGKIVELQFRLPGLPWSEFRTVRSDRRGRFRLAYRFSDDDSRGVRFQLRAYAPAQAGWPFEPAGSRPVIVRGI